MADLASRIISLSIEEGPSLVEKARGGVFEDVRDWVFFSAWRSILSNKKIPSRKKAAVFRDLIGKVDIVVERHGE